MKDRYCPEECMLSPLMMKSASKTAVSFSGPYALANGVDSDTYTRTIAKRVRQEADEDESMTNKEGVTKSILFHEKNLMAQMNAAEQTIDG
eukprot:4970162-Ditylum_brightwellii.AAC.1